MQESARPHAGPILFCVADGYLLRGNSREGSLPARSRPILPLVEWTLAKSEESLVSPDELRWWEMQLGVGLSGGVPSSKRRNDIAKRKVARDLANRGYAVSIPSGDDCAYDLVVDLAGQLERVQVRHTESIGAVAAAIDWLAVYDPTTDRCSYVPAAERGNPKSDLRS